MQNPDKTKYEVYQIVPGITCINDYSDSTSYLVEGAGSALLIDTGWGADNFMDILRGLADKPVALALTHMHHDHIRHASRFDKVYMHARDTALLAANQDKEPWVDKVIPVKDGDVFDLGGVRVEAVAAAGHTPGSMAYLDPEHGAVFTGDAIGSGEGVWMQVAAAIPLQAYRRSLHAFLKRLEKCGPLTFLGGHIGQCGKPYTAGFNPLTIATVRDMIALTDAIIKGETDEQPFFLAGREWPEQPFIAHLGKAAIVYMKSNILA